MLTDITGVPVQPNKAIIGRNAFAHEAGIHQDGMIKNPLTYEIMTPQSVGVPATRLVLGKHSGRHALRLRCEHLGFQLDRHELDLVYRLFLALADHAKVIEDYPHSRPSSESDVSRVRRMPTALNGIERRQRATSPVHIRRPAHIIQMEQNRNFRLR